jgi:Fe-Mn family superoxide dismutase
MKHTELLLSRRRLLGIAAATPLALATNRVWTRPAFAQTAPNTTGSSTPAGKHYPHTLPPLPYAHDALEPHIDAQTMQIHHGKHHQAYVDNLNKALEGDPELQAMPLEQLVRNLDLLPVKVREAVRNNGGGHLNHSMFWHLMRPQGGGQPSGPVADAIMKTFGSFDSFTTAFNTAGTSRFGSGWAWLAQGKNGLQVMSTPNQDNPMTLGLYPIMGNDVWEHAYYLKYQNRRADYLKAWWNVVNWDEVNRRYSRAQTWFYK